MATSPTSKSAPLSNAAKDDVLGSDGVFTFKISDLLANDAGGAKASSFFFGSGDNGGLSQADYMSAHGIVQNPDGSYTATGGDFEYSVQIGNKGTWSTAHVDVAHLSGTELLQKLEFRAGRDLPGREWQLQPRRHRHHADWLAQPGQHRSRTRARRLQRQYPSGLR
jgi:hypothetical protein